VSFVHLHTHSEFSLLDGANRLSDLVERALHYEMPALALTDHGCLFGAWDFRKKAKQRGLKPIIGMEAYVAPGDRRDRTRAGGLGGGLGRGLAGDRAYYHLVLLARDREGYRNLVKLSSLGYTEGFYHRPRVDRELLQRYSAGVIVSSACLAGEVARHLMVGRYEEARRAAEWYASVFEDRYYLEVQAHGTEGQAQLNREVFRLAADLGLPVIATNDAHFLARGDHEAHDVLLCIGLRKDKSDQTRMRYDDGLYFKGPDEMRGAFPEHPEVIENTLRIADEVSLDLEKRYHVPAFPLPGGYSDEAGYLVHLARVGAVERYGDPLPDAVRERLEYELGVITRTGYAGYFLIIWDCIRWARENGIPVGPGRGSSAGSIVSYALRITNLDPLAFDLLFERFLTPERVSMPDIDMDFCFENRGRVIDYVRQKYGHNAVGQIITFGTMKSRAVIRDVGRVLGFEPSETDRIAKLIPNQPGKSYTVGEAVERIADVRKLYEQDDRHRKLFDFSRTLEGLARHASVHAAGIVIAPGPLDEYVPVCVQQTGGNGSGGESESVVVTQYDMNALEDAGMLKMDFLGLKTLTVIHDAASLIRERHGTLRHPVTGAAFESMDDVPLDDPDVYRMLARGGNLGVFQFESHLAMDKLRAMRCDRFDDLVATNALIRPGPLDSGMTDVYIRRKLGQEPVRYPHPALEKSLAPTYGVIVYQEQVMAIARELAGYTWGDADVLRKAVGKKDAELIVKELRLFVERAVARGVDPRTAEDLATQIETFGRYGFVKAHSSAYSVISYQTAWLKAHYPAEFMASLLSAVLDKTDDVVKYIGECRDLARSLPHLGQGLEVLPPDVNESRWKFTVPRDQQIRFGLGAVRGVGAGAVASILRAREEGRPFASLFDFLQRIDLRALNKRACEALIAAGAMDAFGHRAQLLAGLDGAYAEVQAREAEAAAGQGSLFDAGPSEGPRPEPPLPAVEPWPEQVRLAREKEAVGFFISGHPLDRFRDLARAFGPANTGNLGEFSGQEVEIPCVVTKVARQIMRKDASEWGRLTVEDFAGTASVLAFGEAWMRAREIIDKDTVILLSGTVSSRERDEDDPPVFLDRVEPLEAVGASGRVAVAIEMACHGEADGTGIAGAGPAGAGSASNGSTADDLFVKARSLIESRPGPAPIEIHVMNGPHQTPRLRSKTFKVRADRETLGALRDLFGAGRVHLVRTER
jgi:DNA polymerase-3 subunit alpha